MFHLLLLLTHREIKVVLKLLDKQRAQNRQEEEQPLLGVEETKEETKEE
jgi:hypothetical protein